MPGYLGVECTWVAKYNILVRIIRTTLLMDNVLHVRIGARFPTNGLRKEIDCEAIFIRLDIEDFTPETT